MEEPQSPEELTALSAAFDSRLVSLNERLALLEASRPPDGSNRSDRRNQDRWQRKMLALIGQGDKWGQEYLDFLQRHEPLLAKWAEQDPTLEEQLAAWRQSLSHMERSLHG
ncbi:MAG TPA: hypothetical protein VFY10_03040 [Dehalococcoidia bacterium]|nr:hypothetical protein [Dehalococcoidia bacterium]